MVPISYHNVYTYEIKISSLVQKLQPRFKFLKIGQVSNEKGKKVYGSLCKVL